MMGRGDWLKLEGQINAVLIPMGQRLAQLEAKVALLEGAEAPAPVETKAEVVKPRKKAA
jgi:hypothetical protein